MELTDLEICKRIAEIEGVESDFIGGLLCTKNNNGGFGGQYSPLTDDALCFKLLAKYRVYCGPFMLQESWSCRASSFGNAPAEGYAKSNSLNKAICLAIIKAHKEE